MSIIRYALNLAHIVAGYARIVLAGFSLHYMKTHPNTCTLLYGVSCLLDAVDGQAARALGQTSKFGAVLDMVTDRYAKIFLPGVLAAVQMLNFVQVYHVVFAVLLGIALHILCYTLPDAHHPRL